MNNNYNNNNNNTNTINNNRQLNCRRCGHSGCDLRLIGCGCTLHVKCVPLSIIIDEQQQNYASSLPKPVTNKTLQCTICRSGYVSGVQLFPMDFTDLDHSIELRKRQAKAAANLSSSQHSSNADNSTHAGMKRHHSDSDSSDHDDALMRQIQAESSYLLLSHTSFGGSHSSSGGGGSSSTGGSGSSDSGMGGNHRTGRWTQEEITFVDILCSAFDRGLIPLPHGVKLNEFLGDMLLCKSSRLTKKMKNAKLSSRSYTLTQNSQQQQQQQYHQQGVLPNDFYTFAESLSNAQEKFIQSIISESTQLELNFNMTKLWRTHFSNLCLQIGYDMLDGHDWLESLDEMERRAAEADEMARKARRQRMCLALRKDVSKAPINSGIYIQGHDAATIDTSSTSSTGVTTGKITTQPGNSNNSNTSYPFVPISTTPNPVSSSTTETLPSSTVDIAPAPAPFQQQPNNNNAINETDLEYLSSFFGELSNNSIENYTNDVGTPKSRPRLNSLEIVEYALSSEEPPEPESTNITTTDVLNNLVTTAAGNLNDKGEFLKQIVYFMQTEHMPFQHADIWVPSYKSESNRHSDTVNTAKTKSDDSSGNSLRLYHAGHATRSDVSQFVSFQLNEYGVYSTNFSFAPGVGLPGRVYATGKPSWETSIHKANPAIFERAGGAKVYGVKTALGLPLDCPDIGRVIVAMYSTVDIQEDAELIGKCQLQFANWTPEPKWKLVIEMGSNKNNQQVHVDTPASGTTASITNTNAASITTSSPQPTTYLPETTSSSGTVSNTSSQSNLTQTTTMLQKAQAATGLPLRGRALYRSHSMPTEVRSSSSTLMTKQPQVTNQTPAIQLHSHDHLNNSSNVGKARTISSNSSDLSSALETFAAKAEQPSSSPLPQDINENDLEQQIATLLGTYMPASPTDASADLYPHFMSLRLLLLRSPDRRSVEETEMLDILKKSYRGYSVHRSGGELATLVVKDWIFLTSSMATTTPPSNSTTPPQGPEVHQTYSMNLSKVQPQSSGPSPLISSALQPPSTLSSQIQQNPHSVSSYSSFGSVDSSKNQGDVRRSGIVSSPSTPRSPVSEQQQALYKPQVNLVPEN